MAARAPDVLADVLLGELGVCSDVEEVREVPILEEGWVGMFGYTFNPVLWWWFLDTFIDDPAQRRRARCAADEIRRVFIDLAKLRQAMTGETSVLPEALIACLERRVVAALVKGSAYDIAIGARRHPHARASRAIERLTERQAWRTKS